MANTQDLMFIAFQQSFQNRVQYALVNASLAVMTESAGQNGHTSRVTYGSNVLAGTADLLLPSIAVLNNPTIAAEATLTPAAATPLFAIPDSDIQFAVNSCFSDLAGVHT